MFLWILWEVLEMDFSNRDNNQQLADFIREQRLELDLNLNDVSEKIGVPIQHLKNIENGEFSRFDEFYLKMYIKKYASFLSLNVDELYQRFYGEQIKQATVVKIQTQKKQKRNLNFGRIGVIGGAIAVVLLAGIFIVQMMEQMDQPKNPENIVHNPNSSGLIGEVTDQTPEETMPPVEEAESNLPKTEVMKVSQEGQKSVFDVTTESDTLDLKIIFGDNCWLDGKINDGTSIVSGTYEKESTFEHTIKKEDLQNNEGSLVFNIGNATALQMMVNGEVIEIDQNLAPHQYITINMKVK